MSLRQPSRAVAEVALFQDVGYGSQELLSPIRLRKKNIRLDKECQHSVRYSAARCINDGQPRSTFRGGVGQFQTGLMVVDKRQIDKQSVDFVVCFDDRVGFRWSRCGASFIARLLQNALRKRPNLFLIFDD
jgi:hypothetical protein